MTTNTNITIHKTRGFAGYVAYSAWEPYAGHSTLMHIDGVRVGRVGCRPLPTELDALPAGSDERYARVKAWYAAQYAEAYAAIEDAHPGAAGADRDMGEITISLRGGSLS